MRNIWGLSRLCGVAFVSIALLVVPSVADAATVSAPTAVSASLGSFNVGVTVSAPVSADGAPTPSFAVTGGALPAGLSLSGSTITGTLTTPQPYAFEITAANAAGSARATFTGNVDGPRAPTALSSQGTVTSGDFVSTSVSADGSPAPTFDIAAGTLPAGLNFDPATGSITGHATDGDFSVTIRATNSAGSASAGFTGKINPSGGIPTVVFGSFGTLTVGVPVTAFVTSDRSPTFSGTPPAGLTLDPNTGAITGTPATAGPYDFTITAANGSGTASTEFTGNIATTATRPTAVSASLGPLTTGGAGSVSADGSPAPTFSGALPPGLSLNGTTGAITGSPITAGPYSFTITATNSAGSATASFSGVIPSPAGTARLTPLVPRRLLDTRPGGVPLAATATKQVPIIGVNGVPADALAVVLNVTATGTTGPGYLTVFPCGTSAPDVSNLNFSKGQTIANAATVKIGDNGSVCVFTNTTIDLIVDLDGVYSPTGTASLTPLSPVRLLDTRSGAKVAAETSQEVPVAGAHGVPADAAAAVLNVTATGTDNGPGYVTAYPCGTAVPDVSNLNFAAGETIPNAVTVKIGVAGKICLFTSATIHVIVDLNGIYTANATTSLTPLAPQRLLDTRVVGTRLSAGSTQPVQVGGVVGVPTGAVAAVLNVTANETDRAGFATVFPCGTPPPDVSNLNFTKGETIANAVTVTIGAGGKVCVFSDATIDLIVDLDGIYIQPS